MIYAIGDNIYTMLGTTSESNFEAVVRGDTALREHGCVHGVAEAVTASLFNEGTIEQAFAEKHGDVEGYTRFEQLCILSIEDALARAGVDAASKDVVFIISSTKGNIGSLQEGGNPLDVSISLSGEKIAGFFGNSNTPIIVSNACISGVNAQIVAQRMLESGRYATAVVCGCDVQSRFIISGFQSFKALSGEECKPFDAHRTGLNLGEGAATIVYTTKKPEKADGLWSLKRGAIRNDANHISGPSRTGEGLYRALKYVMQDSDPGDIALINAHGTATAYNDEMESIAIDRAGLANVPVNGLKGYYGHTMGAAGVLETIISMRAVDAGIIPATRGFEEHGVSRSINIVHETGKTDKRAFIKMLSGFGGCNAAILMEKGGAR